jgi:Xaa-Pro dipeptidase
VESVGRIVWHLKERGLDALVAASPETTYYVIGARLLMQRLIPDRLTFVIVTADGACTVVTAASDVDHAKRDSTATGCVGYSAAEEPAEVLCRVLGEMGLGRAKLGIEGSYIPAADLWILTRRLPNAPVVAGDEVIRLARMTKSAREIERLRRAEYLTELAVHAAFAMVHEGDTERGMQLAVSLNLMRQGAEAVDFVLLQAAENSTKFHMPSGSYRCKAGDVIHLDTGASFESYRSNLSRNFRITRLAPKQIETYARLWDVQREVIAGMRPGLSVKELCGTYISCMGKTGLVPPSSYLGHGIGLSSHEYPEMTVESDAVLLPGMVVSIEPTVFVQGDARYDIEDTVVVTDAGSEMLAGALNRREIWIL